MYTHKHTHKRTGTYANTQQAGFYSAVLTQVVKKMPVSWNVIKMLSVEQRRFKGTGLQQFTDRHGMSQKTRTLKPVFPYKVVKETENAS